MRPAFAVVGSPLGLVTDANKDAEVYAYGVADPGAEACAGWDAGADSPTDARGSPSSPALDDLCARTHLFTGRSSGPRPGFASP